MGLLIKSTDFVGRYAVAQNSYTKLDLYIDKYEPKYLSELLGSVFYLSLKGYIETPPPTPDPLLDKILAPFREELGRKLLISDGLKEMLLGFVWFEYMREFKFKKTMAGITTNQSENSRETSFPENQIYAVYNESIDTYRAIQHYIGGNTIDYTIYNGQEKDYSYWCL